MGQLFGELAALATSVCWTGSSIFFTISGRRVGSSVVNSTRLFLAVIFLSVTRLLARGALLPADATLDRWFWLGLSGVIGLAVGDALYYQALILVGPGLTTLLMVLAPIISAGMSWVLLGEHLTPMQMAGIVVTTAAVALVVRDRGYQGPPEERGSRFWFGILLGVGAAVGQAAGLITSKMGLSGDFDPLAATLMRMIVAMVVFWAFSIARGQLRTILNAWRDRKAVTAMVAGSTVGPFLGVWLSLVSVQNAPVGVASTLMSLAPIFVLWPAHLIFKERIGVASLVGTAIAVGGVVLLILP